MTMATAKLGWRRQYVLDARIDDIMKSQSHLT